MKIHIQIFDEIILPHVAVSHRVTSVEDPGQMESIHCYWFLFDTCSSLLRISLASCNA